MVARSAALYDSAQRRAPFTELRHLWEYRGLIRLLVTRDLTVRYKRSVLGVWWTLLNPLLTVAVFWIVFSQLFDRPGGAAPFIVYLTAGVLLAGFFAQGIGAAGSGIVDARGVLAKVFVPPEVFSFAAAIAAAINFMISLVPLVLIQLVQGVGIPITFLFVPVSIAAMLLFVAGLGLVVASLAVLFYDVFDLVKVLTQLATYMAATFYYAEIIPEGWRVLLDLNPLYHHIVMFRAFAYGDLFSWASVGVAVGSGLLAFALGVWVFSRNWKNVVVSL
ncbi:MAG: ABC transporter permease [Acidimicrobiia bacterium]|nr:MAG: ABC transporter permease [Acidimicrobiia bacterium]